MDASAVAGGRDHGASMNGADGPSCIAMCAFDRCIVLLRLVAALFLMSALATGAATSHPQAPGWMELLNTADNHAAAARHAQAVELYQQILASDPTKGPSAHMAELITLKLASSLQAQGQFADAKSALLPLLGSQLNNSTLARHALTSLEVVESKSTRLLRRGMKQIRAEPDSDWGYRDLVEGLRLQGRMRQMVDVIGSGQASPVSPAQILRIGAALELSGDSNVAIEIYRHWLDRQPDDLSAREAMLDLAVRRAPLPLTLEIYGHALSDYPAQSSRWRYRLAQRLRADGHAATAMKHFGQLLDDSDLGLQSHLELAGLQSALGDPVAASATYRSAILRWPQQGPGRPGRHAPITNAYLPWLRLLQQHGWLRPALEHWPEANTEDQEHIGENLVLALKAIGEWDLAHQLRQRRASNHD